MPADDALLEVEDLDLEAGGHRLCSGLGFRVRAGERWGILGPNGSGKTTLLHTLAALRVPAGGRILYAGTPVERLSRRDCALHAAIMLQNEDYVFPVTVLERALAGRHPHVPVLAWESPRDIDLARRALARTGLSGFEHRSVLTLSGGERRRLQIAALLCQAPRLALLDEPENDLDLRHQTKLMKQLVGEFSGASRALVMVLHDINLARRYCTHLLLLGVEGARSGPAAMMATPDRLSALYGCTVRQLDDDGQPFFVTD
jgi:iron complex transport system ATP-binding protein